MQSKLVPALSLGVSIFASMFFFTYLPQAAVLALFNGPLAAVDTLLLVASESSAIFMATSRAFLIEDSLVDTFDGTLVARGTEGLLAGERVVKRQGDSIARLGKLVKKPFARFAPSAIIKYFLYLPLNFIPVVGTAVFILAQGRSRGPSAHERYFQLKGMSKSQKEQWVSEKQGAYTSFGLVAALLEMVPVAGVLFAFTNAVGAALWAADLERQQGTAPGLKEQAQQAEGAGTTETMQ